MARVVHFEVPVDDAERAQKFYANVFDWEISGWGGPGDYWLASTGPRDAPGIDGALTSRAGNWAPLHVGVESVDETLERVVQAGGEVLTPKMPIPGVGYMAYCRDTEGNGVGVFQEDPTAQA
jgi:predicted enzyme related to lactoylglutathione lyase